MTIAVKPKIRVPARSAATAGMTRAELMALSRFAVGQYIGGRSDRPALRNWNPLVGSADGDAIGDLPTLRSRSRDLYRNAPLAGGAIKTAVTNVVGTGLRVRSLIDRDFLGLSEAQAQAWERQAERIFRAWAGKPFCDLTLTQNFARLQNLAFRSVLLSGDLLVVRRMVERPGALLATTLQFVEADRISTPDDAVEGPMLVDGVEKDPGTGAPRRYWVRDGFPDQLAGLPAAPARWTSVPAWGASGARLALHLFDRERPDGTRGIPYLAPVMEPLKQLDRYSEAEVMAAVVSAMFTVFVTSENGGGLAGDLEQAGGGGGGYFGLGNGAIVDLAPGEKIEIADPKRPNVAFDPFVQAVLRQIGVALELPFEVLVKHFTASYSASRAALEQAWQFFRDRRAWLVDHLCDPVYEWVITEAVLRGHLEAPGFVENPLIRAAYLSAEWIGPARISLDPLKEAKADEVLVRLKVKTRDEVAVGHTGIDLERKLPQLARETALWPDPVNGLVPAAAPAPEEDEEDEAADASPPGQATPDDTEDDA